MYDLAKLYGKPETAATFITAEIGINHMGDPGLAKRLIALARESGADAVKFQTFAADRFYNKKLAPGAYDLFRSFELGRDVFSELKRYADSLDILFYSTPLDFGSLDFLAGIGCPLIKIASSDITNEPFLYRVRDVSLAKGIPVCFSTGFVGLKKIREVFKIFRKTDVAVQYCVAKYPPEPGDMDLNFIRTLRENFHVPVGFSDHSADIYLSVAGAALGAVMIERHFTDDPGRKGADHAMSLSPARFSELVKAIRQVDQARGTGEKKVTPFENGIAHASMRDLYAARDMRKGEVVREEDILVARPGDGVSIKRYKKVLNSRTAEDKGAYEKF